LEHVVEDVVGLEVGLAAVEVNEPPGGEATLGEGVGQAFTET
jgi:hypothetical protein